MLHSSIKASNLSYTHDFVHLFCKIIIINHILWMSQRPFQPICWSEVYLPKSSRNCINATSIGIRAL